VSVFIDTSALFAVLDRDDAFHIHARAAWSSFLEDDENLITTNYVLIESCALVQNRLGMDALRTLLDDVIAVIGVQRITEADHRAAMAAVLAAGRRDLSLVDCSSFEVMRRLALRHVFAFDRHFNEQGFEVLPASAA
jgi:uncharacterized protein